MTLADHMEDIEHALLQDADELPDALCLTLQQCRRPLHGRARLHTLQGDDLDGVEQVMADVWLCDDVLAVVDRGCAWMPISLLNTAVMAFTGRCWLPRGCRGRETFPLVFRSDTDRLLVHYSSPSLLEKQL